MNAIDVSGLTRYFGENCAVDHVSFTVEAGAIFGFLGPNGAGKTTTIKMLTGQLRPSEGHGRIFGHDIATERDKIKPIIGVVFEQQNVYDRMTASENLRFSARLYGVPETRVEAVLAQVGLSDRAAHKAKTFSNGMKQRLIIARALLHQPRLLFLDEPTKGLDPGVARDIRAIIAELGRQGVTIFLTTHYMEEADRLCDQIGIMNQGNLVALDTPAALKAAQAAPDSPLEAVFLSLTERSF